MLSGDFVCHSDLNLDGITQTLDTWFGDGTGSDNRNGVFALIAEAHSDKVAMLQQACREKNLLLAGGVFPALVIDSEFTTEGVTLIGFRDMPNFQIFAGVDTDEAGLCQKVIDFASHNPRRNGDGLFVVFDATLTNICECLRQMDQDFDGDFDIAGANAGSETFQPIPCLFDAHQLIGSGVLALYIHDAETMVAEHAFEVPLKVLTATSTDRNTILEINHRPAFEVYRETVGEDYQENIHQENFYDIAALFPVGIHSETGGMTIRIPVALNERGAISCVGEIPQGSVLSSLKLPDADEKACAKSIAQQLGNLQGRDMLAFYCAGRRLQMGGDQSSVELKDLRSKTGATHLYGALSLGEISTDSRLQPVFHNSVILCSGL